MLDPVTNARSDALDLARRIAKLDLPNDPSRVIELLRELRAKAQTIVAPLPPRTNQAGEVA